MHLERESGWNTPVDETLDNGHLRLLKLLLSITAGGVGDEDGMADLDVVREGDVLHLNTSSRVLSSGHAHRALLS